MAEQKLTAGAKAAADVAALLRARNPLIWIVSKEEERVERQLLDAAAAAQYEPRFWDCATGITKFDGTDVDRGARDPSQVLDTIRSSSSRQLWVLRDLPAWLRDPTVLRSLRSVVRTLPTAPRSAARAIILISPLSEVPPELQGHAIVIDWPLPDRAEIADLLDGALSALPEDIRADAARNGTREAAIDAAVGLTAEEAQSCYAKSLVSTRRIDPAAAAQEKKRVIAKVAGVEWFDPLPLGRAAVGGLDNLWAWTDERGQAFSASARAYGLPAPHGLLLIGQSGCGKSLMAKAIATAWQVPLLRLDMGGLKSKFVGESEGNLRSAFKVVDAIGRCVLWLDEIEKALAGATQGAADGGVSSDALGALLTWREETKAPVFMVATANNIEGIAASNPELLRRFDAIFFVDLPTAQERHEILRAALRQHGRGALEIDLGGVVAASEGFSGAELAALVPSAMYRAFPEGAREITAEDMILSAANTVPLARTAPEKIEALRRWAKGRARPASTGRAQDGAKEARQLDI